MTDNTAPAAQSATVDDTAIEQAITALHEAMCPCGWGARNCRRHDYDALRAWTLAARGEHDG